MWRSKTVEVDALWKTAAPFRSVKVGDDVTSLLPMRRSLQSEMGIDTIGGNEAYGREGIEVSVLCRVRDT